MSTTVDTGDDTPSWTDAEIVAILMQMEFKTCQLHGLQLDQFRAICRRNAPRLPGRSWAPERYALETGVVVSGRTAA